MKILIVAQTRSGSTSLTYSIANALKSEVLFEPFSDNRISRDRAFASFKNTNNLVVKVIDNNFNQINEFTDPQNFFSLFDKVIGLTRESTHENVTSYLIAKYFDSFDKSQKDIEFSKEQYDNIINHGYKNHYKHSDKIKKDIKSFDIFQVTYEGLYVNKDQWKDLENYLGFKVKRLRQWFVPDKPNTIINKKHF